MLEADLLRHAAWFFACVASVLWIVIAYRTKNWYAMTVLSWTVHVMIFFTYRDFFYVVGSAPITINVWSLAIYLHVLFLLIFSGVTWLKERKLHA
jgi:hypothetical protein